MAVQPPSTEQELCMMTDEERRLYSPEQPRAVEEMFSGLEDQIADLRTLIAELCEDMRGKSHVVDFPPRALKFSR
jgi:hypothetical protein